MAFQLATIICRIGVGAAFTFLSACSLFPKSDAQSGVQAVSKSSARLHAPAISAPLAPAPYQAPKVHAVPPPTNVELTPIGFEELPGWSSDAVERSLAAFSKSCDNFAKRDDGEFIGKTKLGGRAGAWKDICRKLDGFRPTSRDEARDFFKALFQPHAVQGRGIFTGYYEPLLKASLTQQPGYDYPLYLKPEQASGWMANKGSGPDRRALETSLRGTLTPLVWLRDPVENFMLQVQGSGLIELDTGRRIRVSYSGDNGLGYKSVYPAMLRAGFGAESAKSLQSMTRWLKDHPTIATEVMRSNPRYIFFRAHASDGPIGAEGVTLTAGRSMAVDPSHIPLGVPLFIDTVALYRGKMRPIQRLMIAQDVGSAIKGVVRGDVFWGTGEKALEIAGNMKEPGRYFILLPRDPDSVASR